MSTYPSHLLKLIESLKKLPGVGSKSAERFAFQLLTWKPKELSSFADLVKEIPDKLSNCPECGCLSGEEMCRFCAVERHLSCSLCIVASPKDAFAIDSTHEFKGLYHSLGGLISPLEGKGPEQLSIPKLLERLKKHAVQEVVIALDSTVEGDATALYLKQYLSELPLQVFRIAFGIPIGSSIDYIDGGTLARALAGRLQF